MAKITDLINPPQTDNPAPPLQPAKQKSATEYYGLEEHDKTRDRIFDSVQSSLSNLAPIANDRYSISLSKVKYKGKDSFSKADQKEALLKQTSLQKKLYGTWTMTDNATGKTVDQKEELLAHVPYMTERGTFVRNGNEYSIAHQSRLRPGVYTSKRQNGEVQTQFNVGTGGRGFKLNMDPSTGQFALHIGGSKLNVFPILRNLGVGDGDIKKAIGTDLYNRNNVYDDSDKRAHVQFQTHRYNDNLAETLASLKLDPETTSMTLGSPHAVVTHNTILAAMNKMIAVSKGEKDEDSRDAVHFQRIYGPDELFEERIQNDATKALHKKLLWKSTNRGALATKTGYFTPFLDGVFLKSGLSQALEESNPIEILDQHYRVLRTGEHGIDPERVTAESRSVQPSHFGFIDPIRTAESGNVGTDSRFTMGVLRGNDGRLYTKLKNKAGQTVPVSSQTASNAIIAFPGELQKDGKRVRAMVRGKMDYIDRRLVDYELPHGTSMSTLGVNLIPMVSAVSGQRALMGGKFYNQALALENGEAPLVQCLSEDGKNSFEELYGTKLGAMRSEHNGVVTKVAKDAIHIQTRDGVKKVELYHNFPFNRKSFLHNTPVVKEGDTVQSGQLLAHSNFTDKAGTMALGKNLNVAYMPWKGLNYEDGIVISSAAAERMKSEHLYTHKIGHDDATQRGVKEYLSLYPSTFRQDQLKGIQDNGVVKPGTVIKKGDPIILAVRQKPVTDIHRGRKPGWMDASETWDHDSDGVVTDVDKSRDGTYRVTIKSYETMKIGDKLCGRHGDKGVIADIVPHEKMPVDESGNPIEVILNPMGVVTRANPAQLVEAALGKVAAKTGKPYRMPAFRGPHDKPLVEQAMKELEKHGLKDTEDLTDPETGRKYKGIMTGKRFLLKLHHMAEHKLSGRGVGGYTSELQPARGGDEGAKRLGLADLNALISHGATNVLQDAKLVRGQENSEYWKAFQLGKTPTTPSFPFVYKKFLSHLIGSGVNVKKGSNNSMQIMALTDKDIDQISRGEIKEPRGVDMATMKELPGGLFDKSITGGHNGTSWAHYTLDEPMPNPVMEEPIRRMLNLTQKQFHDIIAGREKLHNLSGGAAIEEALKRISMKDVKAKAQESIESGSASKRDAAIKLLNYAKMFDSTGLKPTDMMLRKVPILPPTFRPISATSNFVLKSDANALYVDLMKSNEALKDVKKELGHENAGDERLNLYHAFKAVTGLGDPISPKLQQQGVTGLLGQVFGSTSPKFGMYQRRVLGGTLDTVGRGVISPNPSMDIDHVGLPEESAWSMYKPFIVRRLVRGGMAPTDAIRNVKHRTDAAKSSMLEEMHDRPVLINRAPTLHKYNIMAAMPILVKGNTLQVSPMTCKGFNADFDGDQMNFHVPVSDKAVDEAKKKMLPSRNLFAIKDFDVHYLPDQEFQHGLYLASKDADKHDVVEFESKAQAMAAYRRGEIDLTTPINIKEKKV